MIVDQMTLEFMQSKAPPPIQASLDAMRAGATRRRIVKAGMAGDKAMEGPVLLDTRSPEHLAGAAQTSGHRRGLETLRPRDGPLVETEEKARPARSLTHWQTPPSTHCREPQPVGVPAPTQGQPKGGPSLHPACKNALHAAVTVGSLAKNVLNPAARAFVAASPHPCRHTFPFRAIEVFTVVQSDAEEHVSEDWGAKALAAA
jgi:hypothetical protein